MNWNYSAEDLVQSIKEVGVNIGDTVLVHSDIAAIGIPKEYIEKKESICDIIFNSIMKVIGQDGTIITPTFTYSFCKSTDYNINESSSDVGVFGNYVRKKQATIRSIDPLFSFAAAGPNSDIVVFHGNNSFSKDSSAFKNFYQSNIKILLLGVDMSCLTAAHYAEQIFSATYRFDKLFSGFIIEHGNRKKIHWIYPVRVNIPQTHQHLIQLHADCIEAEILRKSSKLPVYAADFKRVIDFYIKKASKNPWRYLAGPPCDLVAEDRRRTGEEHFDVQLPDTDLESMARALTPLPRHLLSDGYDAALEALAKRFPMRIHGYPTGTHAFTWIVPERWICHSASLETTDGRKVFSTDDNLLHVVSYSKPFSGMVSREELLAHLHTPRPVVAQRHPDAIPFVFKYYERDWGLCCSARQQAALTDESYRVTIESDFSVGAVKVGEVFVEGRSKDCIVFCAHLCHPGQFSDGLSGVLAGLKLMEHLRLRKHLRFSYRMLILPETIGSACWLSHNTDVIRHLKGGLFLEMLATPYPHVLMHSNAPESWFDRLASLIVAQEDAANTDVPFLKAPLNDERMFNATGIQVPMCSLMRISSREDELWPYAEYHTSLDTCENANFTNLAKTVDLLERLVDAAEADRVPRPLWQGELFVSRFNGLEYSRDWMQLLEITYGMDGKRSISDIARLRHADFFEIKRVLDILEQERLITYDEV